MQKLLISTAAVSFMAVSATAAFACNYHSAGHSAGNDTDMTVAETQSTKGDEAMSTFDPEKVRIEEAKEAE